MRRRIACVGAGTIGSSWASLFAFNGFYVNLYDISEDAIKRALNQIDENVRHLTEIFRTEEEVTDVTDRINYCYSMEDAVKDVFYVQESAAENYELKKDLFSRMDEITESDTILATSTSGLRISEIQNSAKKHPERCITVHPYNPPHIIPLVEVVAGELTSKETIENTLDLMKKIGKKPILVKKDVPGMVANRLAAALWREAVNLVVSGISTPEEIDTAIKYGPGLRWAITGTFLTYHLGGGEGGMSHFLEFFKEHYRNVWSDLANWSSYPESSFEKILKGMENYALIKEKDYSELTRWRDKKLIEILRLIE